jgi:hypothetical protein
LRRKDAADTAAFHQVVAIVDDLTGELECTVSDAPAIGLIGWSGHLNRQSTIVAAAEVEQFSAQDRQSFQSPTPSSLCKL